MSELDKIKQDLLKKTTEIKKNRSMGIGELGEPTTVFVRTFRWTLRGKRLQEYYMKKVSFDYAAGLVHAEAYEVVTPDGQDIGVQAWLEGDLRDEELVFTTFDGCGRELYEYRLSGLTLLKDTAEFDYATSDAATRKFTLKYTSTKRKFLAQPAEKKSETFRPKRFDWSIAVSGSDTETPIKLSDRPQLQIEETEINFLSSKTWIPGKANWQDLNFTISGVKQNELLPWLTANKYSTLLLFMKDHYSGQKIEAWTLKDACLKNFELVAAEKQGDNDKYKIVISYSSATYRSMVNNEHGTEVEDRAGRKGRCQPAGEVYEGP